MKDQAYDVEVSAMALRTIRVRAASGADALAKAQDRMSDTAGSWTIAYPGAVDEHYAVVRVGDSQIVGPNSQGDFSDDEGA